jgi:hypothetical protein
MPLANLLKRNSNSSPPHSSWRWPTLLPGRSLPSLHTENSHKFTPKSFADLAAQAGWSVSREWISAAPQFAIFSLFPEGSSPFHVNRRKH